MTLESGRVVYELNDKIDNITKIWRSRGLFGGLAGGLGSFESFGAATANTLLRGGLGANGASVNLFSYDLLLQYQETLDRLFVREIQFIFRNEVNTILLTQVPRTQEIILLDCYVLKSYRELLGDHWAYRWLQDMTLAQLRVILGEKYSLFSTLPGAQGGTVLKGEQLKQQGTNDMQRLEDDLLLYADSSDIPQAIRG